VEIKRYIPPPASELAPYVLSIWRLRAGQAFSREIILPACNLDLLFNLGEPIARMRDGVVIDSLASSAAHVAGLQTSAFATRPGGRVAVLGVSFRIESSAAFVSLPPGEVADRLVEGRSLIPGIADLFPRLEATSDFREQCRMLLRWIGARLARQAGSAWISGACRALARAPADAPVQALAREHRLSARQIRRRFEQQLGIGPAQYLRLTRFARALDLMPTRVRLTDVAHAAGYHDQAHLCRDFMAIAGMSPGAYRRLGAVVPGHIFRP
jgi:AraC-like DNA-binding protein